MTQREKIDPCSDLPLIGVLGTGALGGLYGGLLAQAGNEVHFLARSDYEHIRRSGLRVDTPLGDFQLESPPVYDCPKSMPKLDLVIVAWKTTSNAALQAALQAVCHEQSVVLVLQNGYGVEAEAAAAVGAERVLGGCCFLCSNKVAPGHIKHLDYGRIAFGEYYPDRPGGITPRMTRLAEIFQAAGIDMTPADDLREVRWKKLAWNIPFNGLSVVLDADTHQIMQDPSTSELAESLMREVHRAAAACGVPLKSEHIGKMLEDTRKMVPYASSMLVDYRAGRPIEVEAIFGNPLRAAAEVGTALPTVETLYRQLCFLDRRNRG